MLPISSATISHEVLYSSVTSCIINPIASTETQLNPDFYPLPIFHQEPTPSIDVCQPRVCIVTPAASITQHSSDTTNHHFH